MFRRSYRGLFEGNLFSDDPGPLSYMFGRSWRLFEGNLFSDDPGTTAPGIPIPPINDKKNIYYIISNINEKICQH
jgi:hypothetical protein